MSIYLLLCRKQLALYYYSPEWIGSQLLLLLLLLLLLVFFVHLSFCGLLNTVPIHLPMSFVRHSPLTLSLQNSISGWGNLLYYIIGQSGAAAAYQLENTSSRTITEVKQS